PKVGARIMSLADPAKKMSKSDEESEAGCIMLLDDADAVRRKFKRAVTDSGTEIRFDANRPAITNLLTIYHLLTDKSKDEIEKHFSGHGYAKLKEELAEVTIECLRPFQERVHSIDDGKTDQIQERGAARRGNIGESALARGEFEGPLDLLLYMIRQEQINIYDIPIARITDEYLRYLNLMQELDLALAGDFLVMAAQLIEMKSRMLLPRDPLVEEEELIDPRAELVDRLLEHQKFKAAAEVLWSRATVERAVFTRAELETDKTNPEVAVGLFDLLTVFQEILARHKEEVLMEIEREEVTMADMIERLRNMVRSAGEVNLR